MFTIEQMMHQGNLADALKEVETLEESGHLETKQRANFWQIFWGRKKKELHTTDNRESNPRLWCLTLKSSLLGQLGRAQEALSIAEEAVEEAKSEKSPFLMLEALRSKAEVLSYLGHLYC